MGTERDRPPVYAIVVHHKSIETLGGTVGDLSGAGLDKSHLIVVDNSEDSNVNLAVQQMTGSTATLLSTSNRGYAAAVNEGIGHVQLLERGREFVVLVATHEVRIPQATLQAMRDHLIKNPLVGAVGPSLLDSAGDNRVWSSGGYLTRWLRLARHWQDDLSSPRECDWLDGACVLYRSPVFAGGSLSEDYFMYLEEVDFHQRLRSREWRIAALPESASQSSGGMPGYFAARNVQLFQRRWGRPGFRVLASAHEVLRYVARRVIRGRGDSVSRVMTGLRDGWQLR
jgi:N-acetylglucosaminyl-diphospho-decaprenol L-rhamnosyltransferase